MTDFQIDVEVGEGQRRLPVYLLLDCSGSMSGAPIEAVRRGVEAFQQETTADLFARQTVHVAVVLFGGAARLATPGLVAIDQFQPPELVASGGTPLGQAFQLLAESIDRDVRACIPGQAKGDWKPLVFVLTDGQPTDNWQGPRQEILNRQHGRVLNIVTVGCGNQVNHELMKQIAVGPTFMMDDSEASFKAFFQWVTQSVRAVSVAVSQSGGEARPGDLPPTPQVLQYIP